MSLIENNTTPPVSIIVRTKDRPKLLKRAIQSIAAQTYRPIEVVLVNDGGCDLDIVELKTILGNVSLNYQRLAINTGRAHAGNVGIENTKGEYIGFLDDDDEFYPEHVETLVAFLIRTDYKVAYTDSLMAYKEYDPVKCELTEVKKELIFSKDFNYSFLLFENYIPFMCLLFESKAINSAGNFDTSFDLYEDWDLLIRIGERYPFYHIKRVTADYNQWSNELQISQNNKEPLFLKQSYLKVLSKHMDKITINRIQHYMSEHVATRNALNELNREFKRYMDEQRPKDYEISNLAAKINKLEGQIVGNKVVIEEKDTQIKHLDTALRNQNIMLTEFEAALQEKEAIISAMINTKGWKLLEKYRKAKNYAIAPLDGVKKGWILSAKGLKVLKNEGLNSFLRKLNKKYLFNKAIKKLPEPIELISPSTPLAINPIDSKISIIIPTKNAGDEFDYTLRKIVQQEGIGEIELIVIDSGSKDRTIDIARAYTEKVFQIPPEDFHHAKTRNLAAEKAEGDFLVFTVQDAIPVGSHWLYKLIEPLHKDIASAVSAKQIPRSDADLYACWSYWAHNIGFMGHDQDHLYNSSLFPNFNEIDSQTKRIMATLDNVCLGVRKTVFDMYRFEAAYAEDFELGIQLLKDGHTIMFQSSNAVIHSHNRPAIYYFNRSYIDSVSLSGILHTERKNIPASIVKEAIIFLYCLLKMSIVSGMELNLNKEPAVFIRSILNNLNERVVSANHSPQLLKGDQLFDEFFSEISPVNHAVIVSELYSIFIINMQSFLEFIKRYSSMSSVKDDIVLSVYKIFSNTAGHFIGVNTTEKLDFKRRI